MSVNLEKHFFCLASNFSEDKPAVPNATDYHKITQVSGQDQNPDLLTYKIRYFALCYTVLLS